MSKSATEEFVDEVQARIKAGCQLLFVATGGQLRLAVQLLQKAAVAADLCMIAEWDSVSGLDCQIFDERDPTKVANNYLMKETRGAGVLLDLAATGRVAEGLLRKRRGLVIAHDLFTFVSSTPPVGTSLKRYVAKNDFNNGDGVEVGHQFPIVILSTIDSVPSAISPYVVRVDLPFPELEEIRTALDEQLDSAGAPGDTPERRDELSHLCLGMTLNDAIETTTTAVVMTQAVSDETFKVIEKAKAKVIRSVPGLSHVSREEVMACRIGGYEVLKGWAEEQYNARRGAAAHKLDSPRGTLLVGPSGSGKSMAGRYLAQIFRLPLYMFNISGVKAGVVGESERQMREALNTVSASKECVLLLDEIDKGLGNAHKNSGDSGVTQNLLGSLLTWMNDKKEQIFVVMTANRAEGLPGELLRPGRLDEIWFVDLPNRSERESILGIHLEKRKVKFNYIGSLKPLIDDTDEFSGAEIERVVVSAMVTRAAKDPSWTGDALTLDELRAAAARIRPIAKVSPDDVKAIREYGQQNLKSASKREEAKKTGRTLRLDDVKNPELN